MSSLRNTYGPYRYSFDRVCIRDMSATSRSFWAGIDKCHALQSLPLPILWGSSFSLFASFCTLELLILIKENRAAQRYPTRLKTMRAGWSSLRMGLTGSIILAFVVFHLLHFTTRQIFPEYGELETVKGSPDGEMIHDVYSMVIAGFSIDWISISYVLCMFLLCRHLAHGV